MHVDSLIASPGYFFFFFTYCSYVTDGALTVHYFWLDTVYFLLLALEDHELSKITLKFENL